MRLLRSRMALGVFICAWGLMLAQAALLARSASAAGSPTFRFRLAGEPTTLDWNLAQTPYEIYLLMNLMEGLVHLDANFKPQPGLAESWQLSADRKTYVFKIRSTARWSDGVAVKAMHFVESWKRLLTPMTAAPYAYFLYDIENAEAYNHGKLQDFDQVGVKALDDRTLQVRLAKPVAYWIDIPSFWVTFPIRRDLLDQAGNAWVRPGSMVTAGPYRLVQHDQDSSYVLKPNPYYYRGMPAVESAVGMVIPDDEEALKKYESGGLDFMSSLPKRALHDPALRGQTRVYPFLRTVYLGFNAAMFPTSSVHLRRAIALALSASKLGAIAQANKVAPGGFVPPGMTGYEPGLGIAADAAAARAELKLSGYVPSPQRPLQLLLSSSSPGPAVAQLIQQELKSALGISVTLESLDPSQYAVQRSLKRSALFLSSWIADYPDPDNFLAIFTSTSGNNHTGWSNTDYDRLVQAGREAASPQERAKAYLAAQKLLLMEQVAIRPLYYDVNRVLQRPRVNGLELTPLNHLFFGGVRVFE